MARMALDLRVRAPASSHEQPVAATANLQADEGRLEHDANNNNSRGGSSGCVGHNDDAMAAINLSIPKQKHSDERILSTSGLCPNHLAGGQLVTDKQSQHELSPDKLSLDNLTQDLVALDNLSCTQLSPTHLSNIELTRSQISPAQLSPSEVSSDQLSPSELSAGQLSHHRIQLDIAALNLLCLARLQETAAVLTAGGQRRRRPAPAHQGSSGLCLPLPLVTSANITKRNHRCDEPGCDKVTNRMLSMPSNI